MSCSVWTSAVPVGTMFDDLPFEDRGPILEHIRHCRPCRESALSSDSSLMFDSLPPIEVAESGIEQIRLSVRTLRRARELESALSIGRWARRVAAVAALLLVALLLDPKRPDQVAEESPFAGALGVGAGQLDLGPIDSAPADSNQESIASEDDEMSGDDQDSQGDPEGESDSVANGADPAEERLPDTTHRPLQ